MTAVNGHDVLSSSPSWDESAEQALLGALMESGDARTATRYVTAGDFYRPDHQAIHRAIAYLDTRHQPIDPVTVLDELARRKEIRQGRLDGGYLHTCQAACKSPAYAPSYAQIVREHAQRRSMATGLTLLEQLKQEDLADPDVIARIRRELAALDDVASGITTTSHRKQHLMPASAVEIQRVRWLWDTTPHGEAPTSHGRIPLNALTIGAGAPGVGKSQFGVWLAAQITRGELPGELAGQPSNVIIAAAEDSWAYTIAPRLIAAGADLDRVFRIEVTDDQQPTARLTLPTDTSAVGQLCEQYGVRLFLADPLLSLIDANINDYRATEVRAALEPLIAAAERYEFTIYGLAHFTKNGGADPLTRLAGSGAFGQLIRALIAFARNDDDGTFVMSLEKNNLGRENLPGYEYAIRPVTVETKDGPTYVSRFELGEQTDSSVRQVMRDASHTSPADRAEANESVQWLREHLIEQGGTDLVADIMKAAGREGISKSALYRAKDKLKVTRAKSGFGKGAVSSWSLPDEVLDEAP